jgi:hypothetical protein
VRWRWLIGAGAASFLATVTRIGLAPLLLVPLGLFLWSVVCERQRTWHERVAYLTPGFMGGALLMTAWSALGLWDSVQMAAAYAALPEFRAGFTWPAFWRGTWWGLQAAVVALAVSWRRCFRDRAFGAIVGALVGLELLLAWGRIVPWLRYWIPVAGLGLVLCLLAARTLHRFPRLTLGFAWMVVAANAWLFWRDPWFAF